MLLDAAAWCCMMVVSIAGTPGTPGSIKKKRSSPQRPGTSMANLFQPASRVTANTPQARVHSPCLACLCPEVPHCQCLRVSAPSALSVSLSALCTLPLYPSSVFALLTVSTVLQIGKRVLGKLGERPTGAQTMPRPATTASIGGRHRKNILEAHQ